MQNSNKCPHCKTSIPNVITEDITMTASHGQPAWKGFSHACPYCRTILGVEVNPLSIRDEILEAIQHLRATR